MVRVRAGELAVILGGELIGDPGTPVARIAPLQGAPADSISFLPNPRYRTQLAESDAACVIFFFPTVSRATMAANAAPAAPL